jgi:RHS repeat-associated protein
MIRRVALVALLSIVSVQTVYASSFGRTPGKFGVSPIGSAQYSIPIWTPPGPNGIQPNLALRYDSRAGIGPLGVGWSLAGLGSVTRCNLTTAQDTTAAPVALVTSDGYCLNGNRLRLTSGTYGTAGSTYQTEIAEFSNVTANGTAGNGPAYFTVQARNGNTYQYGFTDTNGNGANSQVLASGSTTTLTWLLSKVIDRAGNNLVINYTILTGTAVPNNILWTPTSAGASTYTYKMLFNYVPNVPQSSFFEYVAGTPVSNPELLSSIELFSGTTVIKDYFLGYQASPLSGREELISIKECADSAGTNCLSPTVVTYQTGTSGLSTVANSALSASGPALAARYDLNGDGYPDLVYINGTSMYVAFGSASGYGTPFNTGVPSGALMGRLMGGAQDGMLTVNSGVWWYYTWNGTSFVGSSTGLAYDSTASKYQLADIDGDGRPDLVALYITGPNLRGMYTGTVYSRLNSSVGGTPSFSTTLTTAFTAGNIASAQLMTPDMQLGKLRHYDFNGDGRDDIVLQLITGTSPNFTVSTYELISNGTTFITSAPIESAAASTYPTVFFTDWNDDKCTDVVTLGTLYVSGCNGTVPASYAIGTVVAAIDYDGDGRTDLMVANGSTLGVYLSKATGAPTLTATSIPYVSTCQYVWMDANGDGLDDLGCWSQTGSNALTYYLHNGTSDLATSFADGYGVTYSPSYVPLSASGGIYTEGTSAVFPNQDYLGPMYVVSSFTSSDGIGGTYPTAYAYAGAIVNVQGRGFQGFTTISSTDSRTGLKDTRTYSTLFPNSGMLAADSITQSAGTNVSVGTYTLASVTLDGTVNNQRYFPYTASSSVNTYEVQAGGSYNGQLITTTATNYGTPDIYGNFSNVVTTVTDEDSGSPFFGSQWSNTTATTISASPSTWCNSLPTEHDVTNTGPGVPAITRHLSFTPDYTNCRETQRVVESGNSTYQVTTSYLFDGFGNVNSQTVTGIGMAGRTTLINWGTTGQFPTQITNPLSQVSYPTFDPVTGKLLSFKDPNSITVFWQYDPFARKTKQIFPDGTSTTWTYNNCATAGCVNGNNRMTIDIGGDTIGHLYLDPFDRILVTSKPMVDGTLNRIETQYDNLGNAHLQGMPCTFVNCIQYWTTNTYDILNRLTLSQRPINASNSTLQSTNYNYQGRSTITTDPLGHAVTQINLVTGAPYRTKDLNGYYINLNRDAFGSVLSAADSLGNVLRTMTYGYGIKAFRKTLNDTDLGSRTYTVDALGELTAYSDGKGQNFSANFDALSRMTSRTEPDLTTTWTWGTTAASHNIGRLASVSSSSTMSGTYTEAYTYDSVGRLSDRQFTIPNLGTLAFDYTYETTTGLLSTITFPASFPSTFRLKAQLAYQYEVPYLIQDAANPSAVWWRNTSMNPRGQITGEATLDSSSDPPIKSGHIYDAVTGWLTTNTAGPNTGSALQNEAYLYDEMGNVSQRQNNNLGLTEDFFYDGLYRLSTSQLNGSLNLSITYATNGNIVRRSDVASGATWTYDPTHIHQVTQAGSSTFTYSYDANGNVSARNGSIIGSTSYNYTNAVGTSTESATFDYGPDRQRWRMVYSGPSGVETTYYATPMFEAVATGGGMDYRHYIYANGRPVVVISHTSAGAVNVRSFLVDHQGSISTIVANATGAAIATESFTAYGNRREASTWSGPPTSTELNTMNGVTREGYTFQTVLGSMGLNHMNGRIEDSVTGRFLSADPRTPNRYNTQSWNRYSYVNNNPVTNTDPTGFCTNYTQPAVKGLGGGACMDMGSSLADIAGANADGNYGFYATGISDDLQALTDSLNAMASASTDAINNYLSGVLGKAAANASASFDFSNIGDGSTPSPGGTGLVGGVGTLMDPNYYNYAWNDPNAFNLTSLIGGLSPGSGPVGNFSLGGVTEQSGAVASIGGFMNSGSNFVNAAEGFVTLTSAAGAATGALFAFGELGSTAVAGVGVNFGGSLLLSAGAAADVGGMGLVGTSLGAAGGIVLLPAFAAGYGIGSLLNPYVQPIISSWYGY